MLSSALIAAPANKGVINAAIKTDLIVFML